MGCPPYTPRFERWGGVVSLLRLALIAVVLASESLLPTGPSPIVFLSFATLSLFYMEIARASVCACMCARVYTCTEKYICEGQGEGWRGWNAAQGLEPGHCPL